MASLAFLLDVVHEVEDHESGSTKKVQEIFFCHFLLCNQYFQYLWRNRITWLCSVHGDGTKKKPFSVFFSRKWKLWNLHMSSQVVVPVFFLLKGNILSLDSAVTLTQGVSCCRATSSTGTWLMKRETPEPHSWRFSPITSGLQEPIAIRWILDSLKVEEWIPKI